MGHLYADSEAFGALKLTESARGVLKGETEVLLREQTSGGDRPSRAKSRRGDLAPQPARPAAAGDANLLGVLRAWRSEVARKRGVPAYVVLHDSTIDGIASARPTTPEQLRDIPGIGDKKLERYGRELIALISSADN
jgi:ATP-dependent DNA helicase RecQ